MPPGCHLRTVGLTRRERQAMNLMATGLCDKEIADNLHLALGTVKVLNARTFRKLGVNCRTQAVIVILRERYE